MSLKHVVSFSGGKDSTAMLLMMREREREMVIDKIICVDTTKEFPEMYEHIATVQEMIAPMVIDIIKIPFDYYFAEHVKTRGIYQGEPGYGWPDFQLRWCTTLKTQAINRVKKQLGGEILSYIGIANDEHHRIKRNQKPGNVLPLVDWGISEADALQYCYSKGLDWGGLYEKFSRVSCFCCPLQQIGELRVIYNDFPVLWQQIKDMDDRSPRRRFRPKETIKDLEFRFEYEKKITGRILW